jgi:hypothetical protein
MQSSSVVLILVKFKLGVMDAESWPSRHSYHEPSKTTRRHGESETRRAGKLSLNGYPLFGGPLPVGAAFQPRSHDLMDFYGFNDFNVFNGFNEFNDLTI